MQYIGFVDVLFLLNWMFQHDCLDTDCFWVSYMHAFSIFVFAPVQHNWACFTWKSALEIPSLLLCVCVCVCACARSRPHAHLCICVCLFLGFCSCCCCCFFHSFSFLALYFLPLSVCLIVSFFLFKGGYFVYFSFVVVVWLFTLVLFWSACSHPMHNYDFSLVITHVLWFVKHTGLHQALLCVHAHTCVCVYERNRENMCMWVCVCVCVCVCVWESVRERERERERAELCACLWTHSCQCKHVGAHVFWMCMLTCTLCMQVHKCMYKCWFLFSITCMCACAQVHACARVWIYVLPWGFFYYLFL